MYKLIILLLVVLKVSISNGQAWFPDNGNGTYKNPVIYADYSDPDVIRVGDDYYMVATDFLPVSRVFLYFTLRIWLIGRS